MNSEPVKVSIGLPVYNGENYLRQTLDSLLAQTFQDFEVIISDNASTDNTEAICREYQIQDSRIKYSRNSENIGASKNYNRVFDLASGQYFKWAAHDDICHPEFLARCVEVLDNNPAVILAYTQCNCIDENGQEVEYWKRYPQNLSSSQSSVRLKEIIFTQSWVTIFGVVRTDVLSKTPLMTLYPMHDYILLAELALHGNFYEVPELLFSYRVHPSSFTSSIWGSSNSNASVAWFDPKRAGTLNLPYWRRGYEHFSSCARVPLSPDTRLLCWLIIVRWMFSRRKALLVDLTSAMQYLLSKSALKPQ